MISGLFYFQSHHSTIVRVFFLSQQETVARVYDGRRQRGAYVGFDYIGFLGETNVKMWTMDLSKTAFVLMHGLLYKWNALHRKEKFNMTDEKLMTLTSIKSRSALRKAKKELEKARLITYYPSNKRFGTTYWITVEQKQEKPDAKAES